MKFSDPIICVAVLIYSVGAHAGPIQALPQDPGLISSSEVELASTAGTDESSGNAPDAAEESESSTIPEPASAILLGLSLVGAGMLSRRRVRR